MTEIDAELATLRETAARCCRKVHIGAAVLPKPLFVPDHDDTLVAADDKNGTDMEGVRESGDRKKWPLIKCATVSTVPPEDDPSFSPAARRRPPTRYARVLAAEFDTLVVEHHLKWSPLVHDLPGPISEDAPPTSRLGRYDFHHVDSMVDFAQRHGMEVKGHVLVWHVTSPPFLENMAPEEVREAVKRHIFTTMAYFRGRIRMWDVVNEALASDGSLVENVFYRKIGPDYIEQCFRWAHEADPEAFLIYNDNKVEGCGCGIYQGGADAAATTRLCKAKAPNQAKADGFFALLEGLVRRGVPVHGAGMQAHFDAGGVGSRRPPTPSMVKRQVRRLGALGLKVNISEMDVRVSRLADATRRDLAQAEIYRGVLTAALSEPAFHGVWLWGFTDRHTWVKNFYYDDTPLVFSEDYARKPSYEGVAAALQTLWGDTAPYEFLEVDYDENGNEWGREWMAPEPETTEEGTNDSTKEGQPDWLQPNA